LPVPKWKDFIASYVCRNLDCTRVTLSHLTAQSFLGGVIPDPAVMITSTEVSPVPSLQSAQRSRYPKFCIYGLFSENTEMQPSCHKSK
jgi:hypothetical protein